PGSSLAPHPHVPGPALVPARGVVEALGLRAADELQRALAHVLLEATAAHVARRAPVLAHEQLGPLVPVRRAAHPDYGREGRALPLARQFGEPVEHFPRLKPLFHAIRLSDHPANRHASSSNDATFPTRTNSSTCGSAARSPCVTGSKPGR